MPYARVRTREKQRDSSKNLTLVDPLYLEDLFPAIWSIGERARHEPARQEGDDTGNQASSVQSFQMGITEHWNITRNVRIDPLSSLLQLIALLMKTT